jgi:hypothetical protein
MHRNDICVIQCGGRADFLEKALLALGVGDFVARQDLHRNGPVKTRIPREEDLAPATAAD